MKNYMNHIGIDPKVMFGKPVIKNTRITVEQILEELGAGKDNTELLAMHPNLTMEGIQAALQFAS